MKVLQYIIMLTGTIVMQAELQADTIDMAGQAPYERCGYCHEYDGNSRMGGFPSLAGQTRDYIRKQLRDFRSGKRIGNMQSVAELLSDEDIEIVAAYFSQQTSLQAPLEKTVDVQAGRQIYFYGKQQPFVPACAACHGKQAEGMHANPRLANQLPEYFQTQMHNFKQAKRSNDEAGVMRRIAGALGEQEIASLAGFLARMPVEQKH